MAVDLHMLISSRCRRDLNVYEEATALFSAAEAGMTRTQICKATGLKAAEVRDGITAGGLPRQGLPGKPSRPTTNRTWRN
jgi:hypothetical protein